MKQFILLVLFLFMSWGINAKPKKPCITFQGSLRVNVKVYINDNPVPPPDCSSHTIVLCQNQGTDVCKYKGQTPPPPTRQTAQGNDVNAQFDALWEWTQLQIDNGTNSGAATGILSVGPTGELLPYSINWSVDNAGVVTCNIIIEYDDGEPPVTE